MVRRCSSAAASTSVWRSGGKAVAASAWRVASAAAAPVVSATAVSAAAKAASACSLRRGRLQPLQMQQHGLGPAQLTGDIAIAHRLAGLLLQRLELAFQGDDDVVEAREIGLGRPQAQLGLVPAGMQPRDPGGLFQERRGGRSAWR